MGDKHVSSYYHVMIEQLGNKSGAQKFNNTTFHKKFVH